MFFNDGTADAELFSSLAISMFVVAGITDIIFIWFLHYSSMRYPRPSSDRKWNEPKNAKHQCCKRYCNEDLSRCCCGARCVLCTCPMTHCCNPIELFIPRYPIKLFIRHKITLNDTNQEQTADEYNSDENVQSEIKELKVNTEKYHKCCCHFCFSILSKLWFLFCGILAFVVFLIFAFTVFFESFIKCLSWTNGQFLGLVLIIFIVCRVFVWFLMHSLKGIWLLFYNTCDANNILIADWWRFVQIFWCLMFSTIYIFQIDPDDLSNALMAESMAKFMLIQGIIWIFVYLVAVIASTICLTLAVFGKNNNCNQSIFNFYEWKCIKSISECIPFCSQSAEYLLVYENNRERDEYWLSFIDFLFGIRSWYTSNLLIYAKYAFVACLILFGLIFLIVGYAMDSWELMILCGWSLLLYYVLIILMRTDHFDDILFKRWNGFTFEEIYFCLKEVIDSPHSVYKQIHSNVIILRDVDIWSMTYEPKTYDEDEEDSEEEPIWNQKECNHNLWISILLLTIASCIVIWFSIEFESKHSIRELTQQYDKTNVGNWNWTDIGNNPYSFCRTANVNTYLNCYDLIWLSQSAWYIEDDKYLQVTFKAWFGGDSDETGWNFTKSGVHFVKSGDGIMAPTVYYIRNEKYKIDLIVVRGSYTIEDWIQDALLWTEPVFVQLVSNVIPLNNIFDDVFLRDLVYYASAFQGMVFPEIRRSYDEPVYDFIVNNITQHNKNYNLNNDGNVILITGHSLGGGVAEIVSSRLHADGYKNVIGFGLSPPGTLWSSKKFGYNAVDLDAATMTVQPRRDPVPRIDVQAGNVQMIGCDAYKPWSCHSSIRSLCEIYHSCADTYQEPKNVDFIKCLCMDLNDWNNCTALVMNMSMWNDDLLTVSSAFGINEHIETYASVDDNYSIFVFLIVIFAVFCFGIGVFMSDFIQPSVKKYVYFFIQSETMAQYSKVANAVFMGYSIRTLFAIYNALKKGHLKGSTSSIHRFISNVKPLFLSMSHYRFALIFFNVTSTYSMLSRIYDGYIKRREKRLIHDSNQSKKHYMHKQRNKVRSNVIFAILSSFWFSRLPKQFRHLLVLHLFVRSCYDMIKLYKYKQPNSKLFNIPNGEIYALSFIMSIIASVMCHHPSFLDPGYYKFMIKWGNNTPEQLYTMFQDHSSFTPCSPTWHADPSCIRHYTKGFVVDAFIFYKGYAFVHMTPLLFQLRFYKLLYRIFGFDQDEKEKRKNAIKDGMKLMKKKAISILRSALFAACFQHLGKLLMCYMRYYVFQSDPVLNTAGCVFVGTSLAQLFETSRRRIQYSLYLFPQIMNIAANAFHEKYGRIPMVKFYDYWDVILIQISFGMWAYCSQFPDICGRFPSSFLIKTFL